MRYILIFYTKLIYICRQYAGSTEPGDLNPQQFKQSQPIMLQKKHETAMKQVKELQRIGKIFI